MPVSYKSQFTSRSLFLIKGKYSQSPLYIYLIDMEFFTDFTPLIVCAISIARAISAWLETKPLNWTAPLKVSTLISDNFKVGSLKIAALTFAVITLSSIYSPVLSVLDVDAHPSIDMNNMAQIIVLIFFRCFIVELRKVIIGR